ncbi:MULTISPECIES: hypothetical protein [Agrobacterium]|uniref:Uncharacterized protein n=1 Tax=Agrobacterium rubi TaxID=28099 RepID=A0AAE7UT60_9HYPH|nr:MULTISPECIES: hypothetical protein [Agrobacterium]MBN7807830.1 hypothetical protein [Agrobacterium rosae]NTE89790.1 hypothetical protein [Agrobacterium rubi]NTF05360.1 hypothetical protein [Agrobacterium rubi]NTF10484.1 hypothetical protein [Agrobacterium rubi]NTF22878.1 hypothetical protein [Agrobacterium rubi]
MRLPTLSRQDFDVLVSRTNLNMPPEQIADIYEVFGEVEAILARVRRDFPITQGPAMLFAPEVERE